MLSPASFSMSKRVFAPVRFFLAERFRSPAAATPSDSAWPMSFDIPENVREASFEHELLATAALAT